MKAQHALALTSLLVLSACGDRIPRDQPGGGSTTPEYVRAENDQTLLGETVTPVRIGELGPSFAACAARGATRARAVPVAVRAAPFEAGESIDQLGLGAEFFICSRTHDQRWFGIVYDEGGRASDRCGVDRPTAQRRTYPGPCAAGWVQSAMVALVSGEPPQIGGSDVSAGAPAG